MPKDHIEIARECGATHYTTVPAPTSGVLAFTFAQLGDFVARVQAQAASDAQAVEPACELAPPNSLPAFDECALRVENSDFLDKRVASGGYGPEHDSKTATQLHRFIYEYDDADPVRSSWFLHRLELLLNEVRHAAPAPAAVAVPDWLRQIEWTVSDYDRAGELKSWCPNCGGCKTDYRDGRAGHEDGCELAAALAATPPAQAVKLTGELIEAVDKWFADNTGLGGCSDKDVSELAAIFAVHPAPQAQDVQRDAERYRSVRDGVKSGDRHLFIYTMKDGCGTKLLGLDADAAIDSAAIAASAAQGEA